MSSPAPLPRCSRLRPVLLAWLSLAGLAVGQEAERYYITARQAAVTPHADLVNSVRAVVVPNPDTRTGLVQDLDFPRLGVSAVAAILTPQELQQLDTTRFRVLPDVVLVPNGTPAGPSWPMDQFCLPAPDAACPGWSPVVYVVDTGVDCTHPEFASAGPPFPPVLFLPGLSYALDLTVPPGMPLNPCTDPFDHGTRMAGCLAGATTGLLGPLGGGVRIKPVSIYDFPSGGGLSTFVSQAISGILGAVSDHQARRTAPYLRERASVLLFAHSTTVASGRFADLDRAIEIAWEEGMHVVMSAGNEGALAARVSPAGAAWGYVSGGSPVRYFFGAPPVSATWFRAAEEFLVAGACRPAGTGGGYGLWPMSNNNTALADAVDGFGPGAGVPAAMSGGGYVVGSGTSYAAAFTAALVSRAVYTRPWASPGQVREEVRAARSFASGFPQLATPAPGDSALTWPRWVSAYHPAPVAPGTAGALDNPDNDGWPNFIEYYCGGDPRYADGALPALQVSHTGASLTLQAEIPVACYLGDSPDVKWEIQRSTDLLTWTAVTLDAFAPLPGPVTAGDATVWHAKAVLTPADAPREYFRQRFFATNPLL